MSAPLDGVTPKYKVSKIDGSPTAPTARYLVLRLDNKPYGSPEWCAFFEYVDALEDAGEQALVEHLDRFFYGVGTPDRRPQERKKGVRS